MMRRLGKMGCCEAGLAGGAGGGGAAASAGGGAGALATGAGGVTTTAGGVAGFSAAGGAGAGGTGGLAAGGVTTTVFSGGAAFGAITAGFSAVGSFAGVGGALGAAVLAGGAGCCCCSRSFSNLRTSPGLEILERSIFGLISAGPAFSFEAGADLAEKCFLIFSASSASTELEWVFFSVIPRSSNTSRIALLLTSSSLARSLIRIFTLSQFLQLFTRSYRPHV